MSIVNLIPPPHTLPHQYAHRAFDNHSHAPRFRVHNPLSIKPVSHPPVSPQQSPPYPLLSDKALSRLFRSNLPLSETPSSRCLFHTLRTAAHTRTVTSSQPTSFPQTFSSSSSLLHSLIRKVMASCISPSILDARAKRRAPRHLIHHSR